jgi:hypothetical protein
MFLEDEGRDNWLVGKDWYLAAQRLADSQKRPVLGLGRTVFHSHPGFAQIYYATALEEDGLPWEEFEGLPYGQREALIGQHVERWRQAWIAAGDEWFRAPNSLGNRGFSSGQVFVVRMNDFEEHGRRLQDIANRLYALDPAAGDELLKTSDRNPYLTPEESTALDTAADKRTDADRALVARAIPRLILSHFFAERLSADKQIEARRLADEARLEEYKYDMIKRMMEPIRFDGWKDRILAESEPEAVATWRYLDEAQYHHRRGRLLPAKSAYEKAFAAWKAVLDKHPAMMDEIITSNDMTEHIDAYRRLVQDDLDGEFPKDFVLQNVLDVHLPGTELEQNFRKREATK